jgi:hypothetical protein
MFLPYNSCSEIDVLECQRENISRWPSVKYVTLPLDAAERVEMAVRVADKIASDDGIQLGCCPQGLSSWTTLADIEWEIAYNGSTENRAVFEKMDVNVFLS